MKFHLRPALWLLASVAMLATACDRDSPSNDGGDPGGNSPIILRGGERLGWDQPIVGGANPSSYTYIMYIDGAATPLTGVTCTGSGSVFTCASALPRMNPGRHTLTLVASQGSAMSAPSRALEVSVVVTGVLPPEEISRNEQSIAQPPCTGTGPCYRSTELLRSQGLISSPVSAPNGRILFVVDGRQIQLVAPNATAASVLLNVENAAARILDIAVPTRGTGDDSLVWVTSVEPRGDDTRMLTITRYRLVEDTLGEAAVVVSMRLPNVEPSVAFDDSHIYIAMPSTGATPASVLRLMADGTTPRGQTSPEFSSVPRELRAIALSPEGQLWVSGVDGTGRSQLGPIESMNPVPRFISVTPDDPHSGLSDITSLAVTRVAGQTESLVLAVASGALYRAPADGSALASMQAVPIARGTPIEVAADDGGVYVVTFTMNDELAVYSLIRLVQ